jgi:putative protein kinase ArgK-like GTPase of G3E family
MERGSDNWLSIAAIAAEPSSSFAGAAHLGDRMTYSMLSPMPMALAG